MVRDFCDGWATVEENTLRDGLIGAERARGLDGDRARPRVMMDAHGDEVGGHGCAPFAQMELWVL